MKRSLLLIAMLCGVTAFLTDQDACAEPDAETDTTHWIGCC
jgi:hypothetical protein